MDGIILIQKPQNLTSHDVVKKIRKIFSTKKVGHFGTLDPMATGLMLVGIGKATRLFPFLSRQDKVYQGQIRLGYSTTTYDATGNPTSPEAEQFPAQNTLASAMSKYAGTILQMPPPYSAKKYQGKPLYYFARKNKEFEKPPSRVHIHYFNLLNFMPPYFDFEIKCSSGTYIRSIAHDLGQDLGCGAHLSRLNRIEIGSYNLQCSSTLAEIGEYFEKQQWEEFFLPLESLLPDFPKVLIDEIGDVHARNGNIITPERVIEIQQPELTPPLTVNHEKVLKLFNQAGQFVALAKKTPDGNGLHPFIVFETDSK